MIMTIQLQAEEGTSSSAKLDKNVEVDPKSHFAISSRYKAGPFLIYDCRDQFYACVDSDGDDSCRDVRDESIKNKENRYPCAPLRKFQDKEACLVKNYEVIESVAFKRFCFPKN